MADHTWFQEYVDAGQVDGTFWKCSVCGAGGGPCLYPSTETAPRWEPFLAGASTGNGVLRVSRACDEALKQIRSYIDERITALANMGSKGISPHYASLLHDALVWTPEKTDISSYVDLLWRIGRFQGRPTLLDVRTRLRETGFRVAPV
jgi:hypothetical protein